MAINPLPAAKVAHNLPTMCAMVCSRRQLHTARKATAKQSARLAPVDEEGEETSTASCCSLRHTSRTWCSSAHVQTKQWFYPASSGHRRIRTGIHTVELYHRQNQQLLLVVLHVCKRRPRECCCVVALVCSSGLWPALVKPLQSSNTMPGWQHSQQQQAVSVCSKLY